MQGHVPVVTPQSVKTHKEIMSLRKRLQVEKSQEQKHAIQSNIQKLLTQLKLETKGYANG